MGGEVPPVRPFHPLADERLPREALRGGRGGLEFRTMEGSWRRLTRRELAAAAAIPSLVLLGIAVGESRMPWPLGAASFAFLLAGLGALALSDRDRPSSSRAGTPN
jgi:hypothetical protein